MKLAEAAQLIQDHTPNKRGHDKKRPRFIIQANPHKTGDEIDQLGHKRHSHSYYKAHEKMNALGHSPERFAALGFIPTAEPVKKHGGLHLKIRRSDSREAILNVAKYFFSRVDAISLKVGVRGAKKDGSMLMMERETALDEIGMTYDSFNEAVKVMESLDMLERQRCWKEKDDGTYGGRPSIYTLKDAFFEQFGIVEEFKSWATFVYDKAKKAAGYALTDLAQGLVTRFDGKKPTKKPQKEAVKLEEGTMDWYKARLPKPKHRAFQDHCADVLVDNPDLPPSGVFSVAFQTFQTV